MIGFSFQDFFTIVLFVIEFVAAISFRPGVNFINVLQAAFTCTDPHSVKFQLSLQYLFTLLGSARIKAAGRTLMKLTPGVNFINIPQMAFAHKGTKSAKKTVRLSVFLALSAKAAHRMLMKLTLVIVRVNFDSK